MLKINQDDMSISITRGDTIVFNVQAKQGNSLYTFEDGDRVIFRVSEAKDVGKLVLEEVATVSAESEVNKPNQDFVQISVSSADTKAKFAQSNKPIDYWYEVSLESAGVQTIIGYDEDGAKILRVFPEIESNE